MAENLGQNVTYTIKGDTLTMTVDLSQDNGLSGTGKSHGIATTHGNQTIVHNGAVVKVGVNVYKPIH
jgi:hypothetical protein